ncbi:MAG: LarC family nickel insertion protein [Deltaproteobacteria bacterium]|nr:LarC family nickel insertion protein [Deltaproteobacteria bacterium]
MTDRRVLYLDLIGGAAGDMLMASLIDLGAPLERVRAQIAALGLSEVSIETREARPAGLRARQIDVMVRGVLADQEHDSDDAHAHAHAYDYDHDHDHAHAHAHAHDHAHDHDHAHAHDHAHDHDHDHAHAHDHPHARAHGHRPYLEIRALLERATLPPRVRAWSLDAFYRLAEAEGAAHGVPIESVEFHEVGADDAIADIVGVATALDALSVDEVVVSPVPLARGLTRGAHGPIPLPGPAVLHLLEGVPVQETSLSGEMVTPTGAALLRAIGTRFGPIPSMVLERTGVGAGHKEWPDRPNIVRALLGRRAQAVLTPSDGDCVIEANLDDLNPQHLGGLERALFAAGAHDVWSQPISMKKGRVGLLVAALAPETVRDAIADAFLMHSTTLGVRVTPVVRLRGERHLEEVTTEHGTVRVKIAARPGGPPLIMPEHEDCERLAQQTGTSIRVVWEAALRAAWEKAP